MIMAIEKAFVELFSNLGHENVAFRCTESKTESVKSL